MSNRNPDKQYDNPSEAIPFLIMAMMKDIIHTGMPGKVISYEPAKKRAVVQLALRTRYTDGEIEEKPPILNVPVCWLTAGGMLIHAPLRAGDSVWLMFSERGLTAWRETFDLADPGIGYFEMGDAVAVAGFGALEVTLASTDGTIWLLRELREDRVDVWEIYDSDGTLEGTVEVGPGRRLGKPWYPHLAIILASRDEVWGTTFDEYEVPYIHRYRVDRTCAP